MNYFQELLVVLKVMKDIRYLHCGPSWDGKLCWPATWIGETVKRPCSDYLNGSPTSEFFISTGYASRACDGNGSWSAQTNITQCLRLGNFPSNVSPFVSLCK
ncbi:unnamed protein product [Allacma fusca]|uniref:G-protein coupled receptors family 2 profile 1 domain-containing protein n=1 Tax=Allacma fusca TaxID=39272 RepID=A0A8J2KK99_9HEXA|nr:unnamed protein product [Allacma fusca]